MNDIVIKVENLSKLYRLGELHKQTNSFREKVTQAFGRIASRRNRLRIPQGGQSEKRKGSNPLPSSFDDAIWALRNVSFEVKRGEIVGIIGRNGAGKTTLLKILSRITKPTEGKAWINGRVGSLLEVGTGFHAELTGRENIFLNGAILGMTKAEIRRKFDEILDFAEVEKFIDTPVKRYSSGMYVRLAFAVAAHLEPEILLVDEVLAVGDIAFQKKCLGKMGDVAKEGRTILFVSHNMSTINQLCVNGIVLKNGLAITDKCKIEKAIDYYIKEEILVDNTAINYLTVWENYINEFHVESLRINKKEEGVISLTENKGNIEIAYSILAHKMMYIEIEVRLYNNHGDIFAFYSPGRFYGDFRKIENSSNISWKFSLPNLSKGRYYMSIALTIPNIQILGKTKKLIPLESDGHIKESGGFFNATDVGFLLL